MQLHFIFSQINDLKSASEFQQIKTSFALPKEAAQLEDLPKRLLAVGQAVGRLTRAALFISCREAQYKEHLIKTVDELEPDESLYRDARATVLFFKGTSRPRSTRRLIIGYPMVSPIPRPYLNMKVKGARQPLEISVSWPWAQTDEGRRYMERLTAVIDHVLPLLNTESGRNWQCRYFHPQYRENVLVDQFNRQRKKHEREEKRKQKATKKNPKGTPHPETGAGRGSGAIPGVFMSVQMRSQLEIRLAAELEERGIEWIYEQERLGVGNYLVDFHLPQLKCWVEVKGKVEACDKYLLQDVARMLQLRDERLFMYTSRRAYEVTVDGIGDSMKHSDFWDMITVKP